MLTLMFCIAVINRFLYSYSSLDSPNAQDETDEGKEATIERTNTMKIFEYFYTKMLKWLHLDPSSMS